MHPGSMLTFYRIASYIATIYICTYIAIAICSLDATYIVIVTYLLDTSSSGSSTDGGIIIGVTMRGIILLLAILTVVLSVVILCIKRYHKTKHHL